jgi:protein-tyrosine phosphatase
MVGVLFVCTGNICRSPTAEGVFRALVDEAGLADRIRVDSAGTHGYHIGEPPDRRSQAAARRRGVDLGGQRAREVSILDFERFDYIVAMERGHVRILEGFCPAGEEHRIRTMLEFAPDLSVTDVPDPYYGGGDGFETVLDMIERAAAGLLADIRANHF